MIKEKYYALYKICDSYCFYILDGIYEVRSAQEIYYIDNELVFKINLN
jgi:hypothetical protein